MYRTKVAEKIKTHVLCSINFSYIVPLGDNVEKYCRGGQATDDNMAHAHCIWVYKATNTPSEYVIFIAFEQQQWLNEHASILPYTCVHCPVLG